MAVLNAAQEDQLREIGTHLRKLRQQQSISVEEVAEKTCIRLKMLKALEEGKLEDLPEPIYIQGFIRRYGDFLGLDGNALAKNFSTDYPPVEFDAGAILGNTIGKKPIPNIPDIPIAEFVDPTESTVPDSPPAKPKAAYLAYILLPIMAIGGLFYLVNRPRTIESVSQRSPIAQQQPVPEPPSSLPIASTQTPTQPANTPPTSPDSTQLSTSPLQTQTPTPENSPITPSPSELSSQPTLTQTPTSENLPTENLPTPNASNTELSSQPSPILTPENSPTPTDNNTALLNQPTPTALPTNTPLSSPIQVSVELQDESWVRVIADGKIQYEGILSKGTRQNWTAEKNLTIRSGNAGAVLVSVNQKEPQPLGKLGDVEQVSFSSEQ